jgi:hypothetical protein
VCAVKRKQREEMEREQRCGVEGERQRIGGGLR